MGKYHCSAVKFLCTATISPGFWETEKCCTACFPILHGTYRGECMCMLTEVQTYCCRHTCNGKPLVSFCTACLNPWLKCMAWSILMWPTVGVFPLPTAIFEADPVKLRYFENTFKSMGAVGNCCGCLSSHRFAFVVSCRMWKKSVSS